MRMLSFLIGLALGALLGWLARGMVAIFGPKPKD
jgi:hypothetical protein